MEYIVAELTFVLFHNYLSIDPELGFITKWETSNANLNQSEVGSLLRHMKPWVLSIGRSNMYKLPILGDCVFREF